MHIFLLLLLLPTTPIRVPPLLSGRSRFPNRNHKRFSVLAYMVSIGPCEYVFVPSLFSSPRISFECSFSPTLNNTWYYSAYRSREHVKYCCILHATGTAALQLTTRPRPSKKRATGRTKQTQNQAQPACICLRKG